HYSLHAWFNQRLPPRTQPPPAETTAESTDARKTNACDFDRFTVEHGHAGLIENVRDGFRLSGFIIMIPNDTDTRDSHRIANVGGEFLRFFGESVLREIAAKQQHVCASRNLGKRILHRSA